MMAARALGARDARVLRYAHSGEISGDFGGVVGYIAAAFGNFDSMVTDRAEGDRACISALARASIGAR